MNWYGLFSFSWFNFFFYLLLIHSISSFVRLNSHDLGQLFTFCWYILVWFDSFSRNVSLLLRYENISFINGSLHFITSHTGKSIPLQKRFSYWWKNTCNLYFVERFKLCTRFAFEIFKKLLLVRLFSFS